MVITSVILLIISSLYPPYQHKEELHGLRQASLKVLISDNLRIRLGGGRLGGGDNGERGGKAEEEGEGEDRDLAAPAL